MSDFKLLVCVSDLHCGSDVGLMPPDTSLSKGNTVGFGKNYFQEWLWLCWLDAIQQVKSICGKNPYVLLVNGDATEGCHHHTQELVAPAIEDHTNMAAQCLRVLSPSVTLITKGTHCHTLGMEDVLAEKLGALEGKARDKWLFNINGVNCNAAHHIGTTSRGYLEASLLSITLGNARLQSLRCDHIPSRVFLRAHRHCGGWYSDGDALMCVTGGWQGLTRHGYKVVTDSIPRPSVLVLDWRDRPEGALPQVHNIQFNPPQPQITNL
jgi:hypothetical protein